MVHDNRHQIFLILFFLFVIFPMITVAVSFESLEPQWTNNGNQPIIVNGNGLNGGPPRWIFLVDNTGNIVGSANASDDPFAVVINPVNALNAGTTEVSLVDCPVGGNPTTGGDSAPEGHWIYYNIVPAGVRTITVNPNPGRQGQPVTIDIRMDQTMKRTPLTITITDSKNQIHVIDLSSITFNDGSEGTNSWNSLTVTWNIPLDAATGVANISIIGETATGVATILPNVSAFGIRTSISGNPTLMRPAAPDSIGGGPETVISLRPQFQWTEVSGGQKAYLEFWESNPIGSTPTAGNPPANPDFSVEVNNNPFKLNIDLQDGYTYIWRVVIVDAGGGVMTSEPSNRLTVDLRPLTIFSPEAGSPKNITQWPPTFNVTCSRAVRDPIFGHFDTQFGSEDRRYQPWDYLFDMSQDPTFMSGVICKIDPVAGMNTNDIFVTPADIAARLQAENVDVATLPEGIWYIRFRARDCRWAVPAGSTNPGYAHVNSTAIRIIEIDNTPPPPPGLLFPPDGNLFYFTKETMPVFIWSKVNGAAKFAIEFAADDQFTNFYTNHCMTVPVGTGFTSESYKPTTAMPTNSPIYWRVKSIDHAGNITTVPAGQPGILFRRLYIDTAPPDGSNILELTPENFAYINDFTPMFAWEWDETVVDDPNDGVEMFRAILEYHDPLHTWPDGGTIPSAGSGRFTVESSRRTPPWDPLLGHLGNLFSRESTITFPAGQTYYWRVKPIDQAGNIGSSSTVWRFYLGQSSNNISPPIIKEPVNNAIVTTRTLPVKVQIFPPPLVPGQPVRTQSVKIYAVLHDIGTITSDDIKLLAGPMQVPPGQDTITLSVTLGEDDGRYVLLATAVDDAGTESNPSNSIPVRIILDRESPQVDHITITSDHEGTTSSPSSGASSSILVQIVFSEEMKKKTSSNIDSNPDIFIYPEKGMYSIKVEPFQSPMKSWSETGKAWTGVAVIPVGKGYDGKASVSISGQMTDLAGKKIVPNPTYYQDYFVIDTAPLIKMKAFYNPTDERDIIISLESSEKLRNIPLLEVDFNGQVTPVNMNVVYEDIYTGVFSVGKNKSGNVSITAYAVDMKGNTGTEKYTFRVVEIDPNEGYNITYPKDFQFKIDSGSFSAKTSCFVMPKKLIMDSEDHGSSKLLEKVPEAYLPTNGSELVPIKENAYDIGPYTLEFRKPVSIEFDISQVEKTNQMGIMNYKSGKWYYVPSFKMGDLLAGASKSTGIYAVMADYREPKILDINPAEGETLSTDLERIEIEFEENGSGLDFDNIEFVIDNERRNVEVTGSRIIYKPSVPLKSGEHNMSLRISDNFGNASAKSTRKFFAPKAFEVYDFYFYPNPSADSDPVIHYNLTQDASDLYIKIYDISNRLVTKLDMLPMFAGENQSATWNRTNDNLKSVANGVYYAKIFAKSANGTVSEKIFKVVVLR